MFKVEFKVHLHQKEQLHQALCSCHWVASCPLSSLDKEIYINRILKGNSTTFKSWVSERKTDYSSLYLYKDRLSVTAR